MRRAGVAIGSLAVMRKEPGALSEKQLQLLQAFADQAVIALENARLFNELQATNANLRETLEQQTATSDILRVISSSPTDTQPVFDAIASNAARLSEADSMGVFRVEGNELRMVAHFGRAAHTPKARSVGDTFALTRGSLVGRALLDRRTVHVHDLAAEPDEEWPEAKWVQRAIGHRTALAIPLMREGVGIGAIFTRRMEVRPFSDKHIALLQTFADQAVIAIENVRLFKELQARNAEVTEALKQQTATAEILRVISSSPTNLQPVFDAILEKAIQLCDSHVGALGLFDGVNHEFVAARASDPDVEKWILSRG
jgi:GAF domain-containing protein